MNPWIAIKADTYREYGRFTVGALLKGMLTGRAFRAIIMMRLCQGVANSSRLLRITFPIFRIFHIFAANRAGLDLSWRTEIGEGLAIAHGWGLVINPETKIGRNVTLFHGVTIGQRDRISQDGERLTEVPVIEDEVWIGPHAIIVGGVTIGRGSRIGGGAFITEDIPPYSIVSGNPSTIVKSNCTPDVLNPFPFESTAQ